MSHGGSNSPPVSLSSFAKAPADKTAVKTAVKKATADESGRPGNNRPAGDGHPGGLSARGDAGAQIEHHCFSRLGNPCSSSHSFFMARRTKLIWLIREGSGRTGRRAVLVDTPVSSPEGNPLDWLTRSARLPEPSFPRSVTLPQQRRRLVGVLDRSERNVPRRGEGAGGGPESIGLW